MNLIRSNNSQRIRLLNNKKLKRYGLVVFVLLVTVVLLFAMTAAWFTNVISAGNLTFQAEAWGFEGSVVVPDAPIVAAPGDSGVVSLRVENTGNSASTVNVNISKAFMDTELQKRIYFYADKTAVINGETVQKQYLPNAGGYAYSLFPHNALILNEQIYTDVQLKWEWVYDVVGYYFRGTPGETGFTVEEYLRPVEYSYDYAQYDSEGHLTMVNANTDVATFLAQLTACDGYVGAYRTEAEPGSGKTVLLDANGETVQKTFECYPIDAENNIWLYLCTKADIIYNTKWDTEYGAASDAASRKFQARITVTGQQLLQQPLEVSDENTLQSALLDDNAVIQLTQDVVLTEALTLREGQKVLLDLNGNQITCTEKTVFEVGSDAQLTVLNGSIAGSKEDTIVFHSIGGQVTLNEVTVTDVYEAFEINDHKTQNQHGANSVVRITNSNLNTEDITVFISGDGTASNEKTLLLIQNSVLHSEAYIAVMGNGTATNPGRWGTDIQIVNSTVSGYYAGIYQPQMQSDLMISGSTISGMTGIAVKGGNVTILDSTISGTGTDSDVVDPNVVGLGKSGYLDTGDGVYIESDYNYAISVQISGDTTITHTASTACAVRVFPEAPHVKMQIIGGTFDSDVTPYLAAGYVCTEADGKFTVKAEN